MSERKHSDDEVIAALESCGSINKAAKHLGVARYGLQARVKRLALKGYSPAHDYTHPVPDGFKVKGVSTYYDKDGKPGGQWVKSSADAERQREMLEAAFAGMGDELPRVKRSAPPAHCNADLLNVFCVTDYHLGMLAWHEETRGESWDMAIAEKLLMDWFARAIALSPKASGAVFAQLGDMLHFDGLDAVTPAHRNLLDADTRFQKLVRVAIRCMRRVIDMLLEKHNSVYVIMAEGNHDPASSIWLREWLAAVYEDEPRVTVDISPDPYYCVEHGLTSLFFHHGHLRKVATIDDVFAAKFREVFGRTKYSYAHMGHLHHNEVKETSLMLVEQHRTLAAPDAYASRSGWMSGRDAKIITYSKRFGEVARLTLSPNMVREVA